MLKIELAGKEAKGIEFYVFSKFKNFMGLLGCDDIRKIFNHFLVCIDDTPIIKNISHDVRNWAKRTVALHFQLLENEVSI